MDRMVASKVGMRRIDCCERSLAMLSTRILEATTPCLTRTGNVLRLLPSLWDTP